MAAFLNINIVIFPQAHWAAIEEAGNHFLFGLIHIRKQSAKRLSNVFHVCYLINKQGQKSIQLSHITDQTQFSCEKPALMSVLFHLPIHNSNSYVRDCNLFPEEPRLALPAPQSCDQVQNEEMKEGFELLQAASG